MFSALFGRQKKETKSETPSIMGTLAVLTKKEEELEKRIGHLQTQINGLTEKAIEAKNANKISVAKGYVAKKLSLEKQLETNNTMLLRISEQKNMIEMSAVTGDFMNVLSVASVTIKEQQKQWDVDKVTDLTDELSDLQIAHQEMMDVFNQPMIGGPKDADIEAELESMCEERMISNMTNTNQKPKPDIMPELPIVPTNKVMAKEDNMESELRSLELA